MKRVRVFDRTVITKVSGPPWHEDYDASIPSKVEEKNANLTHQSQPANSKIVFLFKFRIKIYRALPSAALQWPVLPPSQIPCQFTSRPQRDWVLDPDPSGSFCCASRLNWYSRPLLNQPNLYLFTCLQFVPKTLPTSLGKSAVKLCTLCLVHTAPMRQNAGELKSPNLILASGLFFIGKIYN